MQRKTIFRIVFGLVMLVAAAMVVYPALGQASEKPAAVMYIGTVDGIADEFVGLAVQGDSAVFYICDGQADKGTVSVAEWFVGENAGESLDITAQSGNRVEAQVAATTAVGKFIFKDGTEKKFSLALVTDESSGLLRSEFSIGDTDFIAGWLVLPDGSTRGAVFNSDTGELSPSTLTSYVPVFPVGQDDESGS